MANTNDEKIVKDYVNTILLTIMSKTKNIEAKIVSMFWKNPKLYMDYSTLDTKKFNSPCWILYYDLGKKMLKKGYNTFTEIDTELFLQNNKELLDKYHENGGFETISNLWDINTDDNIQAHIDDISKWGALKEIVVKSACTPKLIGKMDSLNADEIYGYYSTILNNTFINVGNNVITGRLSDDLDKLVEEADKGMRRGFPFRSPILSNQINGWQNGKLLLVGGISGAGKTTFVQDVILASIWECGEKVVIILNEQDKSSWQHKFLTWIINNIILKDKPEFFSSQRFEQGSFTEIEWSWIRQAIELMNSKTNTEEIVLVELKSYNQKDAEMIIKQYKEIGYDKFILDTFKMSADNDNESAWLSMMNDMRKFDDLVKPSSLNVALLCTLQLQKSSRMLRYLTVDNIGNSKNVVDVASAVLLFRRLFQDEYPGMKNEIKVKRPIGAGFEEVKLDPSKQYVIIFVDKNRSGESQTHQIIAEQNLNTLEYVEVGIADIPMN